MGREDLTWEDADSCACVRACALLVQFRKAASTSRTFWLKSYVDERMHLAENFCGVLLSYSYRAFSYNQHIFQLIHLVIQHT